MSAEKNPSPTQDADSEEDAAQEREYIQSEIVRNFKAEWYQEKPLIERARVMLKSGCASNHSVNELHLFTGLHLAEGPKSSESPIYDYSQAILRNYIKIMTSDECSKKLKMLAELTKKFPVSKRAPDFNNWRSGPDWFKPTLEEGLKRVMLGAFFSLMKKRPSKTLPTIGELDSAIREKWKWKGGDKELRNARRELGLNGLPCDKGGRPKKQRGKK